MPSASQRLRESVHDVIDWPWQRFGPWAAVTALGIILDVVIRVH